MKLGKIKEAIERDCAKMARDDFVKSANSIIQNFYNTYSPKYYIPRTEAILHSASPIYDSSNCGGVQIDIKGLNNGYKDGTMWMSGIRGLPEGNHGFVEKFTSKIEDFGIVAESPHEAMTKLEEIWGDRRQAEIDVIIDKYMSKLEI